MTSKREAQKQARQLRYQLTKSKLKKLTVNVKQISKGNWGIRFSPKGTRDKFNYRTAK